MIMTERSSLGYHLGSTDTLFGVTYPYRTPVGHLTCLRYFCMRVPAMSFFFLNLQDTVGTLEQEELNTLSQNKESIRAL